MTSEKQVAANRDNAEKSTGPQTQEGKARSSGNAVKHGLTAKDRVVLADESREQFEAMRLLLLEEMQMGSALEKVLIEEIAASAWRLRRIARIEKEMMDHDLQAVAAGAGPGDDDGDDPETHGAGEAVTLGARLATRFAEDNAYNRLSRYESRIRRAMLRTVHELYLFRREDRVVNADLYRRRLKCDWSGSAGEREVRGPDLHRLARNEEAVAHGYGFRDGAEPYEDYHLVATAEYAEAAAEADRLRAAVCGDPQAQGTPAAGPQAEGPAVGEPAPHQTPRPVSTPASGAGSPAAGLPKPRAGTW